MRVSSQDCEQRDPDNMMTAGTAQQRRTGLELFRFQTFAVNAAGARHLLSVSASVSLFSIVSCYSPGNERRLRACVCVQKVYCVWWKTALEASRSPCSCADM